MVNSVLVGGPDPTTRALVELALGEDGFHVMACRGRQEVLQLLGQQPVDCVLLDLSHWTADGLRLCRCLRDTQLDIPILLITGEASAERLAGLEAGADDCLVRPFELEELLVRVRGLLRRRNRSDDILHYAGLRLAAGSFRARRDGRPINLTRQESQLLEVFMRRPEQVVTHKELAVQVWGRLSPNVVQVYVMYLRRKLEAGGEPRLLHNVRGVGYMLRTTGR
jgi:two-component system response regulator MprA